GCVRGGGGGAGGGRGGDPGQDRRSRGAAAGQRRRFGDAGDPHQREHALGAGLGARACGLKVGLRNQNERHAERGGRRGEAVLATFELGRGDEVQPPPPDPPATYFITHTHAT